jgi:putative N6-adenine-specific DNA methylase
MAAGVNTLLYQTEPRFFAVVGTGLEELAAAELVALGAEQPRPGYRGVHFEATPEVLYRVLYGSRLCSRVLAPLVKFDCHSPRYLYRRVHELPWHQLMRLEQTFAVQAVTSHSAIQHSRYAALQVKDALVDRYRAETGRRPNVDADDPDVALHLHVERNRATLSLDLAGRSLHRRGYRQASVDAPLQETLAAAMIAASGWSGDRLLIDPFCGSGTILCEAWMRAACIPAGYLRQRFGLFALPDFDRGLWARTRAAADGAIVLPADVPVRGSDRDVAAVAAARTNLAALPGGERVPVEVADALQLPGESAAVVISNPPYGLRLGDRAQASGLLKDWGDALKQRWTGSEAHLFYGDEKLVKALGLKPWRKLAMQNGGLDGRFCSYHLFAGAARPRKAEPADPGK